MTWQIHSNMTREVAQTLQETRKMARSIENAAGSLAPLAEDTDLLALERIETRAKQISEDLTALYNGIARQAFGPGSVK